MAMHFMFWHWCVVFQTSGLICVDQLDLLICQGLGDYAGQQLQYQ
jgi:hypothetical protein